MVKQIELGERRLNFEFLKRVNKINTVLGEVGENLHEFVLDMVTRSQGFYAKHTWVHLHLFLNDIIVYLYNVSNTGIVKLLY